MFEENMHFIQGTSRDQIFLYNECLDSVIGEDNSVRLIDAYVEKLDMGKLEFRIPELKTGKPPYRPHVLLKIYIYGYLEKIRSSRNLEKECLRNKELIWLTENLAPDFKTIADFRKDNKKGTKNVFKEFLFFCKTAGLLSLSKVGIDGTKLRAQNGLNNVFKRDTIDSIEKKIEEKIAEYLAILEVNDQNETEDLKLESGEETRKVVEKLKKLSKYQDKVEDIKKLFAEDPELKMYFAGDKDSRFQSDKGKVRPGFNAQIAVDDKNKLIISSDVTNKSNDMEQMTPMIEQIQEVKKELEIDTQTDAVLDAGYHSEKEILNNKDKKGITIVVSDRKEAEIKNREHFNTANPDKVPAEGYEAKDFIYDKERDICICPEGKELYKTHLNPVEEASGRKVFEFQGSRMSRVSRCHGWQRATNAMTALIVKNTINVLKINGVGRQKYRRIEK